MPRDLPRLIDHPVYAERLATSDRIRALGAENDGLIEQALGRINEAAAASRADRRAAQAAAVVAGGSLMELNRGPTEEEARTTLDVLYRRRMILAEAARQAEQQLQRATDEASAAICNEVRQQHAAIVQRKVAALRELLVADGEETALVDELRTRGVRTSLLPFNPLRPWLGTTSTGRAAQILLSAAIAGIIPLAELEPGQRELAAERIAQRKAGKW